MHESRQLIVVLGKPNTRHGWQSRPYFSEFYRVVVDKHERIKPQNGIYYFVSGAAGRLRKGNLTRTNLTAAGFDQDLSFMLNEISGDDLFFQAVSRTGKTVDSGVIRRQPKPKETSDSVKTTAR